MRGSPAQSLRPRLLLGASYLLTRQIIGFPVSTLGIVVLARMIGPAAYGTYVSGFAVYTFLGYLLLPGISPYLISAGKELDRDTVGHAMALLVSVAAIGATTAILAVTTIGALIDLGGVAAVVIALAPALLLRYGSIIPTVVLERRLDYRRIALAEMAVQVIQPIVALAVALLHPDFWAPVSGFWAANLASAAILAAYVPQALRPVWNLRAMLALAWRSLPYGGSIWVGQLRVLANPMIVGIALGQEAVGVVALTLRIVNILGVVGEVGRRVSLAGMGRMSEDRVMLRRFTERAIEAQILLVGLPLLIFSFAVPVLSARGLGAAWRGIGLVFPLVAIGFLIGTFSTLPVCALAILRRSRAMIINSVSQIVILFAAAAVLTHLWGIAGYGVAEILAALASMVGINAAQNLIGNIDWKWPVFYGAILVVGMSWPYTSILAAAPMLLLVASPRAWRLATRSVTDLRRMSATR